jgi:TrmH family RNA methyltransferase
VPPQLYKVAVSGVKMAGSYKKYDKSFEHSYCRGVFPCLELLGSEYEVDALVLPESAEPNENEGIEKIQGICREREIRVIRGNRLLSRLSEKDNCHAVAVFRKKEFQLKHDTDHLVLVDPADMGNIGTIMRTMAGFRISDLAIIGGGADCFHPRVVRSSMGAIFSLRIQRFPDREAYLKKYKDHQCYPFLLDGALSLKQVRWQHPASLIFGNEAGGLESTWHKIGESVYIDHSDSIDSLNLSLAVGIALYEFGS